jgi:aminomethyltransferase
VTVDRGTETGDEAAVDDLRRTALTDHHEQAGAKLGPFAGWAMPIRFAGTLDEHAAVRDHAGVFDVSHLGTVFVEGPDATAVVAATFTNDPARIDDGGAQYTLCCDERGGIVDDLIVYRLASDRWLAVPNAANTAAVVRALELATPDRDATVHDRSREHAVLAVQGPVSLDLVDATLATLDAGTGLANGTSSFGVVPVDSAAGSGWLARTGYTGERGVEMVVENAAALPLWAGLVENGVTPCGLGARDTLRLEAGLPLHGNELSVRTSPYAARLGWAVKLDREPFRGSSALAAIKDRGPEQRLWGIQVEGRRPARAEMLVRSSGATVGYITSGTVSPTLGRPIALAYLDDPLGPGDRVEVDIRGRPTAGEVVKPPFLRRDG